MASSAKVVFTGITGLLGSYFLKKQIKGFEIFGTGYKNIRKSSRKLFSIDITKKNIVMDFVKQIEPQIIIHAVSIGDVDYCEKYPEIAYKVNVEGTNNIIRAAKKIKSKVIFLSSNAIFDGLNPPYDEKSPSNPLDVYGKTKAEGESVVFNSNLNFCILRLITMYGWPQPGGRNNPVSWLIANLKEKRNINIVNDIYNNHLWAGQAAEVIWKIINKNISGVYNIAGADRISRYDLALKVAKVFELDSSLVSPVSSDFFKSIAKRPKNTCFNTGKMEKELGIKPLGIEEGLRLMRLEEVK